MNTVKVDRTATGVVLLNEDATKVLLVTSLKMPGTWVLPKGGLEDGLTPEENAQKEMGEEAGVAVTLHGCAFDGIVEYEATETHAGKTQREIYFLGSFLSYVEWEEFDKRNRSWVDVATAPNLMTAAQVNVLNNAITLHTMLNTPLKAHV